MPKREESMSETRTMQGHPGFKGHNFGLCRKCDRYHKRGSNKGLHYNINPHSSSHTKHTIERNDAISKARKEQVATPKGQEQLERAQEVAHTPKSIAKMKETKRKHWDDPVWCIKHARIIERHANWRGRNNEPYSSDFNDELREFIKARDNYQCQLCGITESEHIKKYRRKLGVHHTGYNKKNSNPDKLITLCLNCHSKTNGTNNNREYWQQYFTNLMEMRKWSDLATQNKMFLVKGVGF